MEELRPYLKEFIDSYLPAIKTIRNIEDNAKISAINYNYANNLRHFVEHFAKALEKAFHNPPDIDGCKRLAEKAINHLENLAPDACQFVAGKKLKNAEQQILNARPFGERSKSIELYNQAIFHWNQGRDLRTVNPDEANRQFTRAVELGSKAIIAVRPMSTSQWVTWTLMFLGWLTAAVMLLYTMLS